MAAAQGMSASRLILNVLKDQGPCTNQRLYAACLDIPVAPLQPHPEPFSRPPFVPNHRKGKQKEVIPPEHYPNPEHCIRSMAYMKRNLKFLEAHQIVSRMTFAAFKKRCDSAGLPPTTAHAKDPRPLGSSDFVWVARSTLSQVQGQIDDLKRGQTSSENLPPSLWNEHETAEPDFNLIDTQVSMIRTPTTFRGKKITEKDRILSLVTGQPSGKARPEHSKFPDPKVELSERPY